mmetsp:Transcript_7461/g.17078  ORF Transcript_7461/g.17078 Transcript_7461/m.17078 type:complete len:176 (-) Transcript_7461:1215-1742(-)
MLTRSRLSHCSGATTIHAIMNITFNNTRIKPGYSTSHARISVRRNCEEVKKSLLSLHVLQKRAEQRILNPRDNNHGVAMQAISKIGWRKGSWKLMGMTDKDMRNAPAQMVHKKTGWAVLTTTALRCRKVQTNQNMLKSMARQHNDKPAVRMGPEIKFISNSATGMAGRGVVVLSK